jgi:hypothetical protein
MQAVQSAMGEEELLHVLCTGQAGGERRSIELDISFCSLRQ